MSTSTSVTELKINKLTKAQYDGLASPSNTELYFVKDEAIDYEDLINTQDFAEVAFSGDYYDLTNRPVIPAAQVNADWNASVGISQILNKPELSTVATTGNYNDLVGKPSITSSVVSGSSSLLTSGGAYSNLVSNVVAGSTANKINVVKAGTTSTITINNVENATTATKLGSTSVGTNVRPIYLNNGVPTQISYTIQKSVPSDAKFTDTTYSVFTGATASAAGTSGLVKAPAAGDQNKFLKGDGNWAVVDSFPSQSGNAGKYLTTNGTNVSWDALADVANSGSYNDLTDKPEIDQSYNSTSSNAQSGKAVAEAISTKQDTITGAATTVTTNNLTASRVLVSNSSGKIAASSSVTTTELGYLDGVTSSVQTQLNNKQATLVSGTNIKTVNNNSLLGSGNITIDSLPSQTGNNGKYLTTNGTTASWVAIEEYTANEVETLWNSL